MKRFWISVAVLCVILATTTAVAEAPYTLLVNGRQIVSDVPPQNINGRILVPLRVIAEELGATVNYDADSRTATINSNRTEKIPESARLELDALNDLRFRVGEGLLVFGALLENHYMVLGFYANGTYSVSEFNQSFERDLAGLFDLRKQHDNVDGAYWSSPFLVSELMAKGYLSPIQIKQTMDKSIELVRSTAKDALAGKRVDFERVELARLSTTLRAVAREYRMLSAVRTSQLLNPRD